MKDEKEQVEIFEEEEILAFTDEEGNEIKLCQIACVEHDGVLGVEQLISHDIQQR